MEKRILVVDDNVPNRTFVVDCLMKAEPEYKVLSAPNGSIALKLCNELLLDLILLDWEMPVLNGLETLKILKQQEHTKQIPVIMYTGVMTDTHSLKNALELGAIEFLRKPIADIELIARIKSILKLQQAEQEKLEMKTRELVSLTLQIAEKNNFLEMIIESLDEIKRNYLPVADAVYKLQKTINLNINNENEWEQIKTRINAVYQGFFYRLTQKHTDLSTTEIRLAALLRIGLSNKEIANILHITAKGIEKSRSRLRKKLNLSTEDNMELYILSI